MVTEFTSNTYKVIKVLILGKPFKLQKIKLRIRKRFLLIKSTLNKI